ncbi:MAG TPA: c-type cytochrome [Planctomycetes bacterium]|nr:c-type cytochrome [Planctomycetota bacterium]
MHSILLFLLIAAPQSQVSGRTDDRAQPGTLSVEEIRASLAEPGALETIAPEGFFGLGEDLASFVPADNPLSPAKIELGRQLYFDKRLSKDGTVSCATCHDPAMGWTDNAPVSTGIRGQKGGRSAPTVVNRLFGKTQFWDGRAASLEEQALGPIGNPIEMGFSPEEAAARLAGIEGYVLQFEAVFGAKPTPDGIAKAIASFERTILSGANKNDYYEQALPFFDYEPSEDDDPEFLARMDRVLDLEREHRMSLSAERGRDLFFGKAKCSACHSGRDFTDELFHNLGVGMDAEKPDLGRFLATGKEEDKGAFKTPSLRNIVFTAPYMHDGSLATLMDVVRHYDKGGTKNPWLSDKIFPLELTEQERQDLVRFMEEALTGPVTDVEVPRLP